MDSGYEDISYEVFKLDVLRDIESSIGVLAGTLMLCDDSVRIGDLCELANEPISRVVDKFPVGAWALRYGVPVATINRMLSRIKTDAASKWTIDTLVDTLFATVGVGLPDEEEIVVTTEAETKTGPVKPDDNEMWLREFYTPPLQPGVLLGMITIEEDE